MTSFSFLTQGFSFGGIYKIYCWHILLFLVLIAVLAVYGYRFYSDRKRLSAIRDGFLTGRWMTIGDFNNAWITLRGRSGLKYEDGPGCYVFLTFSRAVTDGDFSCYEEVYVGQSVHVFERVRQHIAGKGNGDVYSDIKCGKYVYVSARPCSRQGLNDLERGLIKTFNATASYNKTKGGS